MKKISMIILIILFFTILSGCSSQNGSDTVISGNNSYKSENYKNAIELYETAQKEIPDAGEIEFNLGDAYFKNNEISKAVEHFEKAIDKGTRTIQKKSNYNLGNVSIVDAQNQMNSDSKKALEKIREGLSYYQKVLDMNEADSKVHSLSDEDIQVNEDTKHNIASARLFLKNMLDKIKQQQEQNKGNQDKLKELAEKLKKLIETQEGINTKTKNVIENKEQASNKNHTELKQNQAENLKGTNEFSKEFNELTAQSGTNTSQQQSQTLPPENVQKVNEAINNALVEEGIASKHLNNTRLKDAVNPEEKALEQLIEALKNMVNPQEQKQDQQQQQQQQQQQEQKKDDEQKDKDKKDQQQQQQQQKMNPDEAKKELEKLKSQSKKKEKDLEDEWKKQHQVPLQYEPVDKDW